MCAPHHGTPPLPKTYPTATLVGRDMSWGVEASRDEGTHLPLPPTLLRQASALGHYSNPFLPRSSGRLLHSHPIHALGRGYLVMGYGALGRGEQQGEGGVRGGSRGGGVFGGGRGGGGGPPELAALIQAAVGTSITAAMAGVEDIAKAAIEARTAYLDSGKGLSYIMKVHLCHICGVPKDAEVPSIWTEVLAEKTQTEVLSLLDLLLGKVIDS